MATILDKLRGGDLRSVGKADEVAAAIHNALDLFDTVFNGLYEDDPVVRMRSADVLEKVTRTRPQLLYGLAETILGEISRIDQQEVCWHVAQIIPRLDLRAQKPEDVVTILERYLGHKSKIVIVSAMEALAQLAERKYLEKGFVTGLIEEQMEGGSPAVRARGRKLLKCLAKVGT